MSETQKNNEQYIPKQNNTEVKPYTPVKIDSTKEATSRTEDKAYAENLLKQIEMNAGVTGPSLYETLGIQPEKPEEQYGKIERPEGNFKKPEKPDEGYSLKSYFEGHGINVKWDAKTGITLKGKEGEMSLNKDDYTIFTGKSNINKDLAGEIVAKLSGYQIIKDNNQNPVQKTEKPEESYKK